MPKKIIAPLLLSLLLASPFASATVIGTAVSGTGNCFPFGCPALGAAGWGPEYQQVYAASEFGAATTIKSLRFYNTQWNSYDYSLSSGDFKIYLSTTSSSVNGLSHPLANNVGDDDLLVYSGALPGSSTGGFGGWFDFLLSSDFAYDPLKGNLLMRVVSNSTDYGGVWLDVDLSGSVMSRAFGDGSVGSTQYGLVTGFNEAASSVPEPVSFSLVLAGLFAAFGFSRKQRSR